MLFSLAVFAVGHDITGSTSKELANFHGRSLLSTANASGSGYCVNGTPSGVLPSVRVVVGITCCLSMIGAVLIILSYVLIKDIRTKAREILLNLSLMDFIVAAANLIGLLVNFDDYFSNYNIANGTRDHNIMVNPFCKAQAFFAMYATISSILWTNCIAVYIFFHIMFEGKLSVFWTMFAFYVLSYGLPLILNVWFLLTGKLGYSPYGSSGWCSLIVYDSTMKRRYPLTLVFGNDIWIYLTITLVPLIFISLKFYLKYQLQSSQAVLTATVASTVQKVEVKLIFIPIVFLLLRVWSLLLTVIKVEADKKLSCPVVWFFIHVGGIGDSGQGLANAILFVVFTPKVLRYFLRLLFCHCIWRKSENKINIQGNSKVFKYGTIPPTSNSDCRAECSDTPTASEGGGNALFLNTST